MNSEQRSSPPCNLCGQIKDLYEDVCTDCVEQTLCTHLPRLKRALEVKHGLMLDKWLALRRIPESQWTAAEDFQIGKDRLKSYLRESIRDALDKGSIELELPGNVGFSPTLIDELMDHIDEQCTDDLQTLISRSLLQALSSAPTGEAERELMEVVSGKKRARKRYVRDEAVSALVLTDANPFLPGYKALIELRYKSDGGRHPYTQVMDGKISSVWREIKESLPEEVARLIVEDGSW